MVYQPQSWEDSPSTATPITAERLGHIEAGVGLAVGGMVKLAATAEQSTTTDSAPVQVALGSTVIDDGGDDLSAGSGWVNVLRGGIYEVAGYVAVTSAARGGDRNVLIMVTSGTPDPLADTYVARVEITSNNSTTHDTGSWHTGPWEVELSAGDRVYLGFVQHARQGTGTATITMGEDADAPKNWLRVRRVR